MLNFKEKKNIIFKIISAVLITLIVMSVVRTFSIYQDSFGSEFIYTLFMKEVVFSIITAAIVAFFICLILRDDFKRMNNKANNYAFTDGLTGLYNRHYLNDFLEKFDALQKEKALFAVAFIDIDRFKDINDTSGHLTGDCILKHLANKLKSLTRSTDMLCRYGGEEFVIIYNDVSRDDIVQKVEKIREEVQNTIFTCEHRQITISIGVSFGQKGDDINVIINEADEALYIAKRSGRNYVKVFEDKKEAA